MLQGVCADYLPYTARTYTQDLSNDLRVLATVNARTDTNAAREASGSALRAVLHLYVEHSTCRTLHAGRYDATPSLLYAVKLLAALCLRTDTDAAREASGEGAADVLWSVA